MPLRILLEGRPGVGKTTIVRRLVEMLRARGVALSGFVTEEIRERGHRIGFAIESIGGARGVLAHVHLPGPPRVGKYGVDLDALERVALTALRSPADVIIIDELGKMELASEPFRNAVRALFDSPVPVVATVHVHRHPFTDELKARADVELLRVTESSRDALPDGLTRRFATR